MNYAKALDALLTEDISKNHCHYYKLGIRRKSWPESKVVSFSEVNVDTNETVAHLMTFSENERYFWQPNPLDLWADDWQVIKI